MANAVPSRPGQKDGSGDDDALFLKVFSGEVLTAFEETNVFMARTRVRTITSGKSAQFPVHWKGSAAYHTPGAELVGTTVNANEILITVDDLLVADRFLDTLDDAKNHYDYRSILSRDTGRELAKQFDLHVAQTGVITARASAQVSGGFGGSAITDGDADTSGSSLMGSIFDAAQTLDEKDVPDDDRWVYVRPAQYYNLVETDKALNRDFGGNPGVFSDGTIFRIAGVGIVKTNNIPITDISGDLAKDNGNVSTTVALVMHESAVGTVKLMDLSTEMEWDIRRQGWLIIAKYALGHGLLRPEAAVEIKTA